jgi:hypothetical protein
MSAQPRVIAPLPAFLRNPFDISCEPDERQSAFLGKDERVDQGPGGDRYAPDLALRQIHQKDRGASSSLYNELGDGSLSFSGGKGA